MIVMAIDPGTIQSAYLEMDEAGNIFDHQVLLNEDMLTKIFDLQFSDAETCIVCEEIQSFGMAIGKETFQTVHWCGRFHQKAEHHNIPFQLVPRRTIKVYWCKHVRATDSNIWQSMTDFWGQPGTKKEPGKLYGIKSHERSALAIAGWKLDVLKERQYETTSSNN